MSDRLTIRYAVYVIFEQEDKVLLSLRQNTGYRDGEYGVVQGHPEGNEDVITTALREAKEEAGVDIAPEDLRFSEICHDLEGIPYMQFIFRCSKWQGEIVNCEADKCGGLHWFDKTNLPQNIIPKVKEFIESPEGIGLTVRR